MGLQRFPISDFAGGLNTSSGPFELESNEAQDLLNVTLTRRGSLEERAGKTQFDKLGYPSKQAEHMRAWYPNSSTAKWLFASCDGDLHRSDATGNFVQKFDGTPSQVWSFEQMEDVNSVDRLWTVNGTDTPKQFDAAGAISDWTATTGTVPNGKMLRVWKQRMIVAGVAGKPQHLYWSEPNDPRNWPVNNFLIVSGSEDDLDPITWLEVLGDVLIIFKKRSVWAIHDPVAFNVRRIGTPGCEDRFQSAVIGGNCYYFARDGVYATNGIQTDYVSEAINNWFPDNLNFDQLTRVRLAATRDRRLFVALPTFGHVLNNRMLELIPDLRARVRPQGRPVITSGPWVIHSYPVSSMATFRPGSEDRVVASATDEYKIHSLFEGDDDDGAAIPAFWMSGWKKIISEEPFERVRRINIEGSGQVTVELFTDFNLTPRFTGSINFDPGASPGVWDEGLWDVALWDSGTQAQLKRLRPETRGRYHAIRLSNSTLNTSFKVFAMELAIRGGKEH